MFGAVTESGPNYIGLGPDVWIDPDLPLDHINHHCAPNAAFGPRRQLIALRPIEPHDEVTIDYSTTEADPAWTMACGCGARAAAAGMLYAIQRSFADRPEPPVASPLMQLVWRRRRIPAASAFPQLPARGRCRARSRPGRWVIGPFPRPPRSRADACSGRRTGWSRAAPQPVSSA